MASTVTITFVNHYDITEDTRQGHAVAIGEHISKVGFTLEELESMQIDIDGHSYKFMDVIEKEAEKETGVIVIIEM